MNRSRARTAATRITTGVRRLLDPATTPAPAGADVDPRLAGAHSVRWDNECSGPGLSDGRRTVALVLEAWRLRHLVFEAQLLWSELVENAAQHAGAASVPVRMVRRAGSVRVEVRDGARDRLPVVADRRTAAAGEGLGLRVVSTAAPRWGCSVDPDGKTVWFELDR